MTTMYDDLYSVIAVLGISTITPLIISCSGLPIVSDAASDRMDVTAGTTFSHGRGFYDTSFDVTLGSDTPESTIRYTVDGSVPGLESGMIYESPLPITSTTVMRAFAHSAGRQPSDVETHTYIFIGSAWFGVIILIKLFTRCFKLCI